MTKEELGRLITSPQEVSQDYLSELLTLSRQYSYCAPLQSLILVSLHKLNDLRFSSQLHERVLTLPDLRRLFFLLNSSTTLSSVAVTQEEKKKEESDSFDLINAFLEEHPEDSSEIETMITSPAQEKIIIEEPTDEPAEDIISNFLKQGEQAEHIPAISTNEPESAVMTPENMANNSDEDELFTETLARMYIRQGKYERAERILRQIYLEFPKKSGYFAEQLNFLEKLIKINEVR